jgi:hypothetical protein
MTKDCINQIQEQGYCVLRQHLAIPIVNTCREAFWPILQNYLGTHRNEPNRGPHRHFLPMPFDPPCFDPAFFFDTELLGGAMDDRVVADQWGCDVPLRGSEYQTFHVDYQRPLFAEAPDLELPTYMLVVSFGLVPITLESGPIEIVPGTHRIPRKEALRRAEASEIAIQPVPMDVGDVLIRHPWALHRGSPNLTDIPRAVASIRFVRRWYADSSREVNHIPREVWASLTPEQQNTMRYRVSE